MSMEDDHGSVDSPNSPYIFSCYTGCCAAIRTGIRPGTRFAQGDIRGIEGRFAPENIENNLRLVTLVKQWAERKNAAPGQIALAWLLAQKPWIVPIPGTTNATHMAQNVGAAAVRFTAEELAELNAAVRAIEVTGQRLPDMVLQYSGVEAAPKR